MGVEDVGKGLYPGVDKEGLTKKKKKTHSFQVLGLSG